MNADNSPSVVCPVCGGNLISRVAASRDSRVNGDIMRCGGCALTFVHPMPEFATLQETYDGLYTDRERFDSIDPYKQAITRRAFAGYLKQLAALGLKEHRRIADLGGGLGYYAEAAQFNGLDATLVELDPVSTAFARDKLGVAKVFTGTPEQYLTQAERGFDIVFLRHVLEHIPDPHSLMAGAAELLRPGGVLIMETPNNRSAEIMLRPRALRFFINYYRRNYRNIHLSDLAFNRLYCVRPPEHVASYDVDNLGQLCRRHGLDPVAVFSYMTGDPTYWPNVELANVKGLLAALRNGKPKQVVGDTLDVLLYPLRLLAHALGRSASICVYAVKAP